jgi:type IV pilus assembly protein PilQ
MKKNVSRLNNAVVLVSVCLWSSLYADEVVLPVTGANQILRQIPPLDTQLLAHARRQDEQKHYAAMQQAVTGVVNNVRKQRRGLKKSPKMQATKINYAHELLQQQRAERQEVLAMLDHFYHDPALSAKKIALNLKKMPTRDALTTLAKASGLQLMIDNDVEGTIQHIHADNIPVAAVLHSVLSSNNPRLALIKNHNVWRVLKLATAQELYIGMAAREREKDFCAKTVCMPHAQWHDALKSRIERLWQGIVTHPLDKQQSYMVIDETNKNVLFRTRMHHAQEFEEALKKLDNKVPQVRIDARVVIADKDFEEALGFNWSGDYNKQATASTKRWSFMGLGPFQKGTQNPINSSTDISNIAGWALNLVPSNISSLIKIPFVFGTRDMTTKRLNLELNAAESRSEIKTILKPSLLVHNEEMAEILVGQELPLETRLNEAIEGKLTNVTTVNYKDTGMKIRVKPKVEADHENVFLDVFVENSSLTRLSGNEQVGTNTSAFNYTIKTARAQNKVLLKSGQTTLVGGLITTTEEFEENGVPFLRDLPGIGKLFRGTHKKKAEKQLLIFITPTLELT